MMQTALGGAGLAVAFNAPIGGTLFTLEEVTKSFRVKTVLAALFRGCRRRGSLSADSGESRRLRRRTHRGPCSCMAAPLRRLRIADRMCGRRLQQIGVVVPRPRRGIRRIPNLAKAAIIGAIIGLAMFVYPLSVGGGEDLTQHILGGQNLVLAAVVGILAVRFVAGPLSYSAAVPGGLFAPLLAGVRCGDCCSLAASTPCGPATQRSWRFRWHSSEWRRSSGLPCARR